MNVITSTNALSQTLLLSSGYNAFDAITAMLMIALCLAAFICGTLFVARWLPFC